jgi:hypothetical protein
MFAYKITDDEGWNINAREFENYLGGVFPNYKLEDSRNLGRTAMKVYSISNENDFLARIDVAYRQDETAIMFSGKKEAIGLVKKLVSNSSFEWTKQ